jgi:hypothetical protein
MARPPSAAMTPIPSARGAVRSWEFYRTGAGGFDSMDGPSVVLVHGTREDGLASSTGAPRSAQIWCVASSSLQSTARARTASTAGHLRPQAPWALRRSVPRSTPACSSPRPVRQGRPPCARLDVGRDAATAWEVSASAVWCGLRQGVPTTPLCCGWPGSPTRDSSRKGTATR